MRTPVGLIHHSIDDVNEKLRLGRYFSRTSCARASHCSRSPAILSPLSPQQVLQETRDYHKGWFESADDFLQSATEALERLARWRHRWATGKIESHLEF
jgi:hypothetical protein